MPLDILEALRRARIQAGWDLMVHVPGFPITEAAASIGAEVCTNEKVAMEMALGASATGRRSAVLVKQVGMNLLADPLVISATHTIGSGLVVLVGDDLGPRGSQVEEDSRYFGPLSQLPVLEPRDPSTLSLSLVEATRLSEEIRAPVLVRITSRLLASIGPDSPWPEALAPNRPLFDRNIWQLNARGRHLRYHQKVLPLLREYSETCPTSQIGEGGGPGVVVSGTPASHFLNLFHELDVSYFNPGCVHPLPRVSLNLFLKKHHPLVILEEGGPFIEGQLQGRDGIYGRLSSHLSPLMTLQDEEVRALLTSLLQGKEGPTPVHAPSGYQTIHTPKLYRLPSSRPVWDPYATAVVTGMSDSAKGRSICPDCPFRELFMAVGALSVNKAGDAGCSILSIRDPWRAVDMVYGLGSSIGVASGFSSKGIALIGDFALVHSGFQGLLNALWMKKEVLVIVLINGVAAMTGGQEAFDPLPLIRCLVPGLRFVDLPDSDLNLTLALREELGRPGVSVIAVRGICPPAPQGVVCPAAGFLDITSPGNRSPTGGSSSLPS